MPAKTPYRWERFTSDSVTLRERGSMRTYDRAALTTALQTEIKADRPVGICGYKWERRRVEAIAKFKAGLALLDQEYPQVSTIDEPA